LALVIEQQNQKFLSGLKKILTPDADRDEDDPLAAIFGFQTGGLVSKKTSGLGKSRLKRRRIFGNIGDDDDDKGQKRRGRRRGTDTVNAMLTPGEYVVNKKSAAKNMGILEEINSGVVYFKDGGRVHDIPESEKFNLDVPGGFWTAGDKLAAAGSAFSGNFNENKDIAIAALNALGPYGRGVANVVDVAGAGIDRSAKAMSVVRGKPSEVQKETGESYSLGGGRF